MTRLALASSLVVLVLLACAPPAFAAWTWPLRGEVITAYRNGDDPYAAGQHRGIDIAGPVGAPVVAAVAGEIRFAGVAGSSGLTVSVRSADGGLDTSYLHLAATAVKAGEHVAAGQRLGTVGTSGQRSAAAPHLHFGVRDAGTQRYHDPLGLLPPLATVPEARPQAPAPAAAPGPSAAQPAVGRVPASEPTRIPAAQPRRVPAAERRRVPDHGPRHVPSVHRLPTAQQQRLLRRQPGGAPAAADPQRAPVAWSGRGARRHAPVRSAAPALSGDRASDGRIGATQSTVHERDAAPSGAAPPSHPARSDAHTPGSSQGTTGPDAGWALACLGLLGAAALVGTSGGGRTAARQSKTAVQRLLAPLTGRL